MPPSNLGSPRDGEGCGELAASSATHTVSDEPHSLPPVLVHRVRDFAKAFEWITFPVRRPAYEERRRGGGRGKMKRTLREVSLSDGARPGAARARKAKRAPRAR